MVNLVVTKLLEPSRPRRESASRSSSSNKSMLNTRIAISETDLHEATAFNALALRLQPVEWKFALEGFEVH